MKLAQSEYEYFNNLNSWEFYAMAHTDFERYHNFIKNESKGNKQKRHARFDEERKQDFARRFQCVENCQLCPHKNCTKN